jgi:hypothetical protein
VRGPAIATRASRRSPHPLTEVGNSRLRVGLRPPSPRSRGEKGRTRCPLPAHLSRYNGSFRADRPNDRPCGKPNCSRPIVDVQLNRASYLPTCGEVDIRVADGGWGSRGVVPCVSAPPAPNPTRLAALATLPTSGEGGRRMFRNDRIPPSLSARNVRLRAYPS